ncbi:MAG: LysM peptidoglycan-binding domain-containing protein [Pelagimonas sp.]|uniref:LysM peptidoglycan-binding domain-containing protein n=1 Tax=Pelagimonas sp. TaxID=2073170 RepID=UPI003D6C3164
MLKRLGALAASAIVAGTMSASAQETCGGEYTVKRGDSLSLIADKLYKNVGLWTSIQGNNSDKIGSNPNNIRVGMTLRMSCINGLPTGLKGGTSIETIKAAAAAPVAPLVVAPGHAATRKKINILTGDDFAPFTDRGLPKGGILADVVEEAMKAAQPAQGYAVHWVNDWSSHHEPLLSNALLDIGFPWFKPDCESDPETYRCANLRFSESMFEVLMLLFVNKENPIAFNTDADLAGKTLCRPKGYSTFIFEQHGRNWLKNDHITLHTGDSPSDCFELLAAGKVDGAVLNEFSGRKKIKELGLQDQIVVAKGQPISVDGNHMVVHKSHPNGPELLAEFEKGLAMIKENGTYQRIIDEHMTRIWAEF